MSCAHPLKIKNPHWSGISVSQMSSLFSPTNPEYFSVPCGYCLNCRVDKRNFMEDVFKYHFNDKGCGAFVTLTYDDYHLSTNSDGVPCLSKRDVSLFIQRLRKKISRLPYKVPGLNADFKYICVGEIGGSNVTSYRKKNFLVGRPHYHLLFAGLDWQVCKKILHDEWRGGIVDVGAIKKGGIRYVLKYYDKQIQRKEAREVYEKNGLVAPFKKTSFGLSSDFILSKRDEIIRSHGQYKKGNLMRPIPTYYKNVLRTGRTDLDKWSDVRNTMRNIKLSYGYKGVNGCTSYSLQEFNNFKHQMALNKEQNLSYALNQYYYNERYFSFDTNLVDTALNS